MEQSSSCLHCVSELSVLGEAQCFCFCCNSTQCLRSTVPPVSVQRGPVLRPLLLPGPGPKPSAQQHSSVSRKGPSWRPLCGLFTQSKCGGVVTFVVSVPQTPPRGRANENSEGTFWKIHFLAVKFFIRLIHVAVAASQIPVPPRRRTSCRQ